MHSYKYRYRRWISLILCVVILFTTISGGITLRGAFAASAGDREQTATQIVFQDGIDYTIRRSTRYMGNRTYAVQVDVSSDLSSLEHARVRTAAQNGYITIQQTGYYLLELWGGDGADGQVGITGAAVIPLPTPEGEGASGGYVYGKVFLKAGQTLVYNIGTNGTSSIGYDDGAGGVNGDGGTHGEEGSYMVGGGGGYSAVYLFEEGEFQPYYVTETEVDIPEAARLSRYIMIAGGGGGGGAGIGGTLLTLAENGSPPSAPNGGSGGNINRGVSMSLLGEEYDVPGYVFSGRNGSSSGSDTTWIGRGGTNVPGSGSTTNWGVFEESSPANDWTGTFYTDVKPGAGGSGNFRGGGGGSGYAGGSGGSMKAQLISAHVGGGGGGSSFIADELNGEKIQFLDLDQDTASYLSGNQPVGAETGGAFQITYLSGVEDEFYEDTLKDITLSGTVSRYFDIYSMSGGVTVTQNTDDTSSFTASGLTVLPSSPASSGTTAKVTLYLKAKDEFLGGNAVPMLGTMQLDFLDPNDGATPVTITADANKTLDYVNVPISGKMRTHSYTTNAAGTRYELTKLYEDDYYSYRNVLSGYWQFDYVSSISDYAVYLGEDLIEESYVAPTQTATYTVKYTVSPKQGEDPEVTVGPVVEDPTTITGTAVISVVEVGTAVLNGLTVTAAKNLSYSDGAYTFSASVDQTSDDLPVSSLTTTYSTVGEQIFTATQDGWYYVQAWGGNGGSSGTAIITHTYNGTSTNKTEPGASGGSGGYVANYFYLQAGQTLTLNIGAFGARGSNGTNSTTSTKYNMHARSTPGSGGGSTSVTLDSGIALIAGGGGGGGSSYVYGRTKDNKSGFDSITNYDETGYTGQSGSKTTYSTTYSSSTQYNGGTGGWGSINSYSQSLFTIPKITPGAAGTAGSNYMNSAYGTTQNGKTLSTSAQIYAKNSLSTTKTGTDGQVSITLIESADMLATMDTITGIQMQSAFSCYFDLSGVELDAGQAFDSKAVTNNDDGSVTITYTSNTYGQIAQFTYVAETASDGVSTLVTIKDCDYTPDTIYEDVDGTRAVRYTANLEFIYTLVPKAGFLGGNDVPVLAYGQIDGQPDTTDAKIPDYGLRVSQGEEFMNVPAADPTDFANVECAVDLQQYLSVHDKTIHLGDSVSKSELYTFTPPAYDANAWEDDYAYFAAPVEELYTPDRTTVYPITAYFLPRTAVAEKATIVGSVGQQDCTLEATVYVEVPVKYELTNLKTDGEQWTLYGEDFGCTLSPASGYLLPEQIRVTINGAATDAYTYNPSLGTISIDAANVTGPIVITAAAEVKTYEIHYLYSKYDPDTDTDILQQEYVQTGIEADSVIDWTWLNEMTALMPEKTGYQYVWTFDTADSQQPQTMPANNLWVYGGYEKRAYQLTIHYQYANGTQAAESYTQMIPYADSYTVASPAIKGYMADTAIVTGVQGDGAVSVTVTYTPSRNQLLVLYLKPDGTELGRKEQTVETDASYSIDSPVIEGYTPDTPTVSGTMSGDESETIVVYYQPNTYLLTFQYRDDGTFAEATLDGADTKKVEYDHFYSYDPDTKTFTGLPTAQLAGYTFAGWYLDEELTQPLNASDRVTITEDTTVYAKWERAKFKLTIRYEFLYTDGDFLPEGYMDADAVRADLPDRVEQIEYGAAYSIELPAFTGYSSYSNYALNDQEKLTTLSGTMPGQNRLVVITYEINTYTVVFKDQPGENVTYSDGDAATTATDAFDTVWETLQVKHNVVPVYDESLDAPAHTTREAYTYAFTGWKASSNGAVYSGKSPALPAATGDCAYYAMYDATENIVSVTRSGVTSYYTNVADALVDAESDLSTTPYIRFRRNDGNGNVVDLDGDTIVFGNTYTGTTAYSVAVDLNGCVLQTTQGEAVIENTLRSLSLTLTDSGSGGAIRASADGDVTALDMDSRNLTVQDAITIEAFSANGSATAIRMAADADGVAAQFDAAVTISATAMNGTAAALKLPGTDQAVSVTTGNASQPAFRAEGAEAVGIIAEKDATISAAVIIAEGDTATGLDIRGGQVTVNSSAFTASVTAQTSGTAVRVQENGTLVNTIANTDALTVTSSGEAYGIRNAGTVDSVSWVIDVDAGGDAYGLYNDGGSITVSGVSQSVDITADSVSGSGYGLYNAADGAPIGGNSASEFLNQGAFAGSSYGLYSADDSIYAAGNDLYFKGADEDSALEGVIHTDYHQTDAPLFREGYYRLAKMRTIQFVTNGGSKIETIEQFYNTPLAVPATQKSGYDFVRWHKNEALTNAYTIPLYMPDEDLILYAEWGIIEYQYALDTEFKEVTVRFYKNDPTNTSDSTILKEVVLTRDNPNLIPPDDPTFAYSNYLYVFSGWYTSKTTSSSNYFVLDGDISKFADENGIIELYAGWNKSNASYKTYSELSTDSNPAAVKITSAYSTSSYSHYMYYRVPKDGTYTIKIANIAAGTGTSYRKNFYIRKYTPASSTSYTSVSKTSNYPRPKTSLTTSSYSEYTIGTLSAGDVVMLQIYGSSSYTGTSNIYAYISSTPDLSEVENYQAYSQYHVVPREYTVADGVVDLPIANRTGYDGYKFVGWADSENAPAEDYIMQITPDMIDTVAPWQTRELWRLYSQWAERTWDACIRSGRDFSLFTETGPVSIRPEDSVSIRFVTEDAAKPVSFRFAAGLPAGTILTMIDRSSGSAAYYTYTVGTDTLTELPADAFTKMGGGQKHSGSAVDLTLQICYANAAATAAEETVSLFTDGITAEAEATYSFVGTTAVTENGGDAQFDYLTEHRVTLTVPALTGQGFGGSDKVFLRIRWEDLILAPGALFMAGGKTAVVYDGEYAALELGTVDDHTVEATLELSVRLSTMMQNEFSGKTFHYEICVIPTAFAAEDTVFGAPVKTAYRMTQKITLTETASLTVASTARRTAVRGEALTVDGIGTDEVKLYLCQQAQTGELTCTVDCATVFDGVTLGSDGELSMTDGSAAVTGGAFTATVSTNAVEGKYFLKIILGDKYELIPITVLTAN